MIADRLWTLEDVAEYLQVRSSVVKRWIHYEGLPYLKIGKHLRFDSEDVKEWVEGRKFRNFHQDAELKTVT